MFHTLDGILNNKIMVYGAGIRGEQCETILRKYGINIVAYIDSDTRKVGAVKNGIIIISPEQLSDYSDSLTIVVSVKKEKEKIIDYLKKQYLKIEDSVITYDDIANAVKESLVNEIKPKINFSGIINSKKTILYDYQIFSMQRQGGVSRYNYEIINRISLDDRFAIDFFEGMHNSCFDFGHFDRRFCNYFGIKHADEADAPFLYYGNAELIKYFTGNRVYSLYHPTYYDLLEYVNYRNLVITVHDLIQELFDFDPETVLKKKKIINKADGIICVSENTKKDLIKIYGIDEKRIRVIYEANSLQVSPSKHRPISYRYLLYVGNREYHKNYRILAEAYAQSCYVGEYKLVFFGGKEFSENEELLFKQLNISDSIVHLYGDDFLLADLYTYADAFIYPSEYEGFGLPILEAMHYGTPVIAADNSSLPEVGGDACLYFDARDPKDLKDKIELLLSNKHLQRELSNKGKLREKNFSWDKAASETAAFYVEIMNGMV